MGYKVVLNKSPICCSPCWCAKCRECGAWLTKHAFTEEDAASEAQNALDRTDRWGHDCPKKPDQLELVTSV